MKALQQLGVVEESSGRAWKRVFVYSNYLRIMTEGTERPGPRNNKAMSFAL